MFYRTTIAADASVIPPLTFADSRAFVTATCRHRRRHRKQGFLDIGSGC